MVRKLKKNEKGLLVNEEESFSQFSYKWEKEWQGMPEFIQDDLIPFKTISIYFKDELSVKIFSKLVGQIITKDIGKSIRSIWYPKVLVDSWSKRRYIDKK